MSGGQTRTRSHSILWAYARTVAVTLCEMGVDRRVLKRGSYSYSKRIPHSDCCDKDALSKHEGEAESSVRRLLL